MQAEIGIIGGSGLYDMAELTDREDVRVDTPFGDPSGPYVLATLRGRRVAFLARHGAGHRISPSELNFRANIFGMKALGVHSILSASAVGSLKEAYKPLDIVVPDQFYDRTRGASARSSGVAWSPMSGLPTRSAARSPKWPETPARRWARPSTGAARTCAWRGRNSRRWPSHACTGRGAWTSSA